MRCDATRRDESQESEEREREPSRLGRPVVALVNADRDLIRAIVAAVGPVFGWNAAAVGICRLLECVACESSAAIQRWATLAGRPAR